MSITDKLLVKAKIIDTSSTVTPGDWITGFYTNYGFDPLKPMGQKHMKHCVTPKGLATMPVEVDIETLKQYHPEVSAFDGDWIEAELNKDPGTIVSGAVFSDLTGLHLKVANNKTPSISFTEINLSTVTLTNLNITDSPELLNPEDSATLT